jgi:hypothetical protein
MEAPEATTLDFSKVPHVAGVPRYLFRTGIKSLVAAIKSRDPVERFERELWLWFFAGVLKQRWADRRKALPAADPSKPPGVPAPV